jgi:hypothetical protein
LHASELRARRNSPLLNMAGTVAGVDLMAVAAASTEAEEDFTATGRFAVVAEDSAAA